MGPCQKEGGEVEVGGLYEGLINKYLFLDKVHGDPPGEEKRLERDAAL